MAWLMAQHAYRSSHDHIHRCTEFSFADRKMAREELHKLEGSDRLFDYECWPNPKDGIHEEPDNVAL